MDRDRFIKLMENPPLKVRSLTRGDRAKMCTRAANNEYKNTKLWSYGRDALTVAIEELSELIQSITKVLRLNIDDGEEIDRLSILEEMADVSIQLENLQNIFGISDEELEMAKNVKEIQLLEYLENYGLIGGDNNE